MKTTASFTVASIDPRFLEVPRATLDWWDRRVACESCANCQVKFGDKDGGMRCSAAPVLDRHVRVRAGRWGGQPLGMYCIDASADGGPCGRDALLFVAR